MAACWEVNRRELRIPAGGCQGARRMLSDRGMAGGQRPRLEVAALMTPGGSRGCRSTGWARGGFGFTMAGLMLVCVATVSTVGLSALGEHRKQQPPLRRVPGARWPH
jgi:hypothetical protein